MKLEQFKQILNDELVACFQQQISREATVSRLRCQINHADEFAGIREQIDSIYGIDDMYQVWEVVKKASRVSEAVQCIAKKHKELAAVEPSPTIHYQYSCIVAERLMNVLRKSLQAELFNRIVLKEVQKYLVSYSDMVKANPSPWAFGTLDTRPQQSFFGTGQRSSDTTKTPVISGNTPSVRSYTH